MTRMHHRFPAAALRAVALLTLGAAGAAPAATYFVSNVGDGGAGKLEQQ